MTKMLLNTVSGRKAIQDKLNEVQKRTRSRVITLGSIETVLDRVVRNLGIPHVDLAGVVVHYTGAEHFPGTYKGIPESTHFRAMHNGRRWEIIDIWRDVCPNNSNSIIINLTDSAKESILEHISIMSY